MLWFWAQYRFHYSQYNSAVLLTFMLSSHLGDGYCKLSSPAVLHQEEYNVHVDCDFLLLLGSSWGPFLDVNMLLHPSLHLSAAPHYIQIYNVWYFYICHTVIYIYILSLFVTNPASPVFNWSWVNGGL